MDRTYVTSGGFSNLRRCSTRRVLLPIEPEPEPELSRSLSLDARSLIISRGVLRDCSVKAEAFVARYRPGIGLSGVLSDNIAIILWVWIGDGGIGENTETAVDGFRGADGVVFIKEREDTTSSRLLQRRVTSYIILYWVEITGQRRRVFVRMICWIAPISLRRGVELEERRVTISFERVKGLSRVAK